MDYRIDAKTGQVQFTLEHEAGAHISEVLELQEAMEWSREVFFNTLRLLLEKVRHPKVPGNIDNLCEPCE